jgi:hypothetical protein
VQESTAWAWADELAMLMAAVRASGAKRLRTFMAYLRVK